MKRYSEQERKEMLLGVLYFAIIHQGLCILDSEMVEGTIINRHIMKHNMESGQTDSVVRRRSKRTHSILLAMRHGHGNLAPVVQPADFAHQQIFVHLGGSEFTFHVDKLIAALESRFG